jgi:hypothetical protein
MFNSGVFNGFIYNGQAGGSGGQTVILPDIAEGGEMIIPKGVVQAIGSESVSSSIEIERVSANTGKEKVSGGIKKEEVELL